MADEIARLRKRRRCNPFFPQIPRSTLIHLAPLRHARDGSCGVDLRCDDGELFAVRGSIRQSVSTKRFHDRS